MDEDDPIGLDSRFMRESPASLEGPEEAWLFATIMIDHGTHILTHASKTRPGHLVTDLVMAALVRRALITAEGIRVLLQAGIAEGAFALFRTLLDIELNLTMVARDKSGRMARRLAAYHCLTAKRHGTRILAHPTTRGILAGGDDVDYTIGWTRRWSEFLGQEIFDDVRDSIRESRNWHGYDSVEAAFRAIGEADTYLMLYEVFTPFVHASNTEFDFDGFDEGGHPTLKALPERDPRVVLGRLSGMLLGLSRILETYLEARAYEDYPESITVNRGVSGDEISATPLTVLQIELHRIFGGSDGDLEQGQRRGS